MRRYPFAAHTRRREMRELLARAGLRPVGQFGGFVGHRYAIAAIRA